MTFNHESIGFWLTRRAQLSEGRVALDFEDRAITYGELNDRSNRLAATLLTKGVRPGNRVAVLSENTPEYLEVLFACAKIGAVLAPVSWRLSQEEMNWQLRDSEPDLLFASGTWMETAHKVFEGERIVFGTGYEEVLSSANGSEPDDRSGFEDPLMILYTSGTTGRPKGAVLTHGNFFWANLNMVLAADIGSDEVSLVFLPMFHIGGWNVNTLSVLLKGGIVVLERSFDAARTIGILGKKRVTLLMGVPATYLFMSQLPDFETADFSSVRLMIVGGAPMPESLLEKYGALGIDIVQGYGLTEAAPNALILPTNEARRKLGSAGKPYFFSDTRLRTDDGTLVDRTAEGEIVVGGPVVMQGYWNREEATAETIRDGWLHTGDIARIDEEGFFFIVDRKKDMILSGGENIYPAEIENAIYEISSVSEVAVIGIPNEQWGESAHAIVVPKEGEQLTAEQVISHCESRLGRFKIPRSVEIRGDPLPRTPAGKVRKPELRAPHWEGRTKKI